MDKVFWEDPYLTELYATVVRKDGNEITLDRTIIFSFSGGQESDRSTINEMRVKDSRIDESGVIWYMPDGFSSLATGDRVSLKIDWEKRYRIMKLHSATHMAMAALFDIMGEMPVFGANVSSTKGRVDLLSEQSLTDVLSSVESQIREVVRENLQIITRPMSAASGVEQREWLINDLSDYWRIPCGGTHPRTTGEIGVIAVKRKNLGKGKERVEVTL